MAVSITQEPGTLTSDKYVHETGYPTYLGMYDSSYASYSDYKYIFKIYDVNGLLSTNYVAPHKNVGTGYIDVKNILKSQFYSDFNPEIRSTTFESCPGSIREYGCLGYGYYNGATASTVTFGKAIAINANYDGFITSEYRLNSTTSKALTKRDATTYLKLTSSQFATLRFLNGKLTYNTVGGNSYCYELYMRLTRAATGIVDEFTSYINNPYYSANFNRSTVATTIEDVQGYMIEAGTGPRNVQSYYWNWNWSTAPGGSPVAQGAVYTAVTLSVGDKYEICAYTWPYGTAGKTSQMYRYEVVCTGNKTPIELAWRNELGGYDYFNFDRVSKKMIENTRSSFIKNRDVLNSTTKLVRHDEYDSGETVIRQDIEDKYTVNTNLLTKTEAALLDDLWVSSDVYAYINSTWYPIILEIDSVMTTTTKMGLLNYEVTFRLANKRNKVR